MYVCMYEVNIYEVMWNKNGGWRNWSVGEIEGGGAKCENGLYNGMKKESGIEDVQILLQRMRKS